MAIWVARAGEHGEHEQFALEKNLAVVGWDLPDLRPLKDRSELLPLLQRIYTAEAENTLKNWETQLWAFAKRIAVGDVAILPRKRTGTVALGKVVGPYRYDEKGKEGTRHQVPVEWLKTDLPRQSIDSDLRFSIGGGMTVFQVSRNNAEERFRALLSDKTLPQKLPSDAASQAEIAESISQPEFDPEAIAHDKIAEHINRKFRGHELERLVNAILVAQGYVTLLTDKGADGGVDIIGGKGPMGLEAPKICVQVKSQDKPIDVKPVRELKGVLNDFKADLGLFVSWSGFTSKADEEARHNFFQIRLWGPEALIEQLLLVYDRLDEDLQKDIPLKRIWALVED